MYCCSNCFYDKFLKDYFSKESKRIDSCSFCGSNNVGVLEPEYLSDLFQIVMDLYKTSTSPEALFLHEQFQKDWFLFPDSLSFEKRKCLIDGICAGRISSAEKYIPRIKQMIDRSEQWNTFREELKHVNRFFPVKVPANDNLRVLFDSLILPKGENPREIYRARINKKGQHFKVTEMGRPPNDRTPNGRANPLGISYLYAASDTLTAISEVQPYKGEIVTVVKIQINATKVIADLRDPKRTISPFGLEEESLESLYSEIPYLVTLGEELSKPIIPKEAALEYLPSQYLCEFIKSIGFAGVLYQSSLGEGFNLALFDDTGLDFVEKTEYIVTGNNVRYNINS
jgi:hypothetical protein